MVESKLSVTIITLNEENDLPRALESIKNLADEIIVVDSGSYDRTVEIAKKHGAKVFSHTFENFSSQKNFAVSKATGDWILSLDGDEEISSELAEEIKTAFYKDEFDAYTIPRKNIILGKFIRYSRWQPDLDRHIWLWKKGSGQWQGEVHEEVMVKGKVGRLKNAKVHHQYKTISEFLTMVNNYSDIEAKSRFESGTRFNILRLITDPIYNFLVRYFYRLGFLDGWRGFVLSYLMGAYHFLLWAKIWQLGK